MDKQLKQTTAKYPALGFPLVTRFISLEIQRWTPHTFQYNESTEKGYSIDFVVYFHVIRYSE